MKILRYTTRQNFLVALVTDEDAYLLQRFPDESTVLRDIDGYCKDDTMYARDIKVIDVEPEEVSTILKYRYLIENHCDLMFCFIANLQCCADCEDCHI
ncbi:hypothetical protein INVICTA_220 [Cronobacter phage vB_CsaM_Invicta]|nr:hypothetical protein INVICTA_220 [Cronobacter phage vB_CsaM_Invicta]